MNERVIVCGSRKWYDRQLIQDTLSDLMIHRGWCPIIVHGAARGADRIADEEAGKCGFLTEPHPANWDLYGKSAGFIRNIEMAQAGADLCIAFWDGSSAGTKHMMDTAKKYEIPVEVVMKP